MLVLCKMHKRADKNSPVPISVTLGVYGYDGPHGTESPKEQGGKEARTQTGIETRISVILALETETKTNVV